jgi:hypothetical protein
MTRDVQPMDYSEIERTVLGSAFDDAPPDGALDATLAAATAVVGAGAVGAPAAKASAVLTKTGGGLVKIALVATLGISAAAGISVYARRPPAAPSVAPPPAQPAKPPPPLVPTASVTAGPTEPSEPTVASKPSSAARRAVAAPVSGGIVEETDAIDRARAALRRGDAAAALSALDRRDARFGRGGVLGHEATVVRVEALVRAGRRAEAVALARGFLAHNPNSPYASRVRGLLDRAEAAPGGR